MYDRNPSLNQSMGEHDLFTRDFVPPIAAPMNRRNHQIAALLVRSHLFAQTCCGRFRKILHEVYSGRAAGGFPLSRDAARCRPD
jgi:hypothetical protein